MMMLGSFKTHLLLTLRRAARRQCSDTHCEACRQCSNTRCEACRQCLNTHCEAYLQCSNTRCEGCREATSCMKHIRLVYQVAGCQVSLEAHTKATNDFTAPSQWLVANASSLPQYLLACLAIMFVVPQQRPANQFLGRLDSAHLIT